MDKKYHFITGLPRSGSTLLSSILRQNPRFHASITDPVASLVRGVIDESQKGPGMRHEATITKRRNMVKGLIDGYYQDTDKEVIFNTNRAWTLLSGAVADLYPDAKMLVCVRDIKWVLDSFELAHRRNPLTTNTVTGGNDGTVYSRVESLMTDQGVVGFPYVGIKQAITGPEKHKLMLIEYDNMCKDPERMMRAVYNFIGEEYFDHDFENVEASWDEYDSEIGIKLHDIRKRVEYKPRQSILPPDIQNKYHNMEVWRF